jgi:uncharacterized membrane protein
MRQLLLIAILIPAAIFAQRGGGGGGGGSKGGGMNIPQGNFGPTSKFDRISAMLQLDKDQKKTLKQTFDDAQKEAAPVHEQIVKARVAIGEAVAAGKPQDEITKAVNAEAALEVQMTTIEMKAFTKFVQGLEADQQPKAGSGLFPMMRGMFSTRNWNSE